MGFDVLQDQWLERLLDSVLTNLEPQRHFVLELKRKRKMENIRIEFERIKHRSMA